MTKPSRDRRKRPPRRRSRPGESPAAVAQRKADAEDLARREREAVWGSIEMSHVTDEMELVGQMVAFGSTSADINRRVAMLRAEQQKELAHFRPTPPMPEEPDDSGFKPTRTPGIFLGVGRATRATAKAVRRPSRALTRDEVADLEHQSHDEETS